MTHDRSSRIRSGDVLIAQIFAGLSFAKIPLSSDQTHGTDRFYKNLTNASTPVMSQ